MYALGISQDLYNGGVALSDGKRLLYAANEERFSRIKNHGGFPHEALSGMLAYTGVAPSEISEVCVAGILTPPLPLRLFPFLQRGLRQAQDKRAGTSLRNLADWVIHHTPVASHVPGALSHQIVGGILPFLTRQQLPAGFHVERWQLIEHHATHAYAAWNLSGFEQALAVTADGMGDGLSLTIGNCRGGSIERIAAAGLRDSLGLFFEALTEAFGFVPSRDEGKLTGLAAHGDPERVSVESPFRVVNGLPSYSGPHGLQAVQWSKQTLLGKHAREDVAAWAQQILDETLVTVCRHWLKETGNSRLVLSGGTFGNVKLNQRLYQMNEVEEIFVAPNMGDGGNAVGALAAGGLLARYRCEDVFLGDSYSDAELEAALKAASITYVKPEENARAVAGVLHAGKSVGRLAGRMEWGPRALGNRSILAAATDPAVPARLNEQLRRSDFMPFAPAMLAEEASRFLRNYDAGAVAGEFMTVCFDCSSEMKERYPAVVHVDGTARTQLVRKDSNPDFHAILQEYAMLSGAGVLLNTSFNLHEEPIIRTPQEAVNGYLRSGIDCLSLGPFLAGSI